VVVGGRVLLLVGHLAAAVAVADGLGAQTGRCVHGCAQVHVGGAAGLHQQDVAVGADGADHVQVQGDLLGPAGVADGVGGATVLVDLPEAATGRRAGRQPEEGPV